MNAGSVVMFQRETLSQCLGESGELTMRHWEEIARNKELFPLDPDIEFYHTLEKMDRLRVFTVRKDGVLTGYAVYFVGNNKHYKTVIWALSDIFWLAPESRKSMVGLKLFKYVEAELKKDGVNVMHTTYKIEHPAAGRILNFLGHTHIEAGYAKVLNEAT